ncbi:unnamed protein product [Trichobilharzia szidati]|nr:unnamed protein product [Trichobilharzia szidati]
MSIRAFIPNIILTIIINGSILFLLTTTTTTTAYTLIHSNNNDKYGGQSGQFNSEMCNNWTLNTLSHGLNIPLTNYSNIYQYIPKISIIIISHNENALILKNTLESILNSTTYLMLNNNIEEIILIDDYSDPPIDDYIASMSKLIRILRNPERMGLIKSRMNGARNASGDILVFLDAHVETLDRWLEPLVVQLINLRQQSRSQHHRHRQSEQFEGSREEEQDQGITKPLYDATHFIVSPVIISSSDTMDYNNIEDNFYVGGFSWDLIFRWHHASNDSKPQPSIDPYHLIRPRQTPALAGGIYAVWRDDFFHYGGYDEEMSIWGGENIELSLRTWMCHGQIEIVPCSRVGHLFRDKHPYTFPAGKEFTILRNHKRTVLVWFLHDTNSTLAQEYLAYFYTASPEARVIPAGDIKSRKQIANSLKCHDFTWYLKNIYPLLKQEAENIQISDDAYYLTAFEDL